MRQTDTTQKHLTGGITYARAAELLIDADDGAPHRGRAERIDLGHALATLAVVEQLVCLHREVAELTEQLHRLRTDAPAHYTLAAP